MSEYGIRIKNFEAASVYEYAYGFRENMDETNAILSNSLFKDFLVENGMEIENDSTKDIICLAFSYKTKDAAYVAARFQKLTEDAEKIEDEKFRRARINRQAYLNKQFELNREKCVEIARDDLRIKFYKEGITIPYRTFNRNGKLVEIKRIHYKMLFRTPGKAKKGTVMFINETLYDKAREFLYMGIELPAENAPIVEIGAYSSLVTSSIIGKVQIKPEQILILKDVDSFCNADAILIKTDEIKRCYAERVENYPIKNTLFDGQALIDSSIFPEYGDGYILLRHHFCKCAAFNTNIQVFMKDYFGDTYETAKVTDMFGNEHYAKDIRLITTDNAIKFLKFEGITYEYWLSWLAKNDYMFGIVKTAHESKLGGNVQRMSYQMVNALDINTMPEIAAKSVEYIERLKYDNNAFLEFLERNSNFSNDYEVLIALVNHNPEFLRCDYFRDRKKEIIRTYLNNLKEGHIIQNADNETIVGSPYAMLLHAVGDDPLKDPTFEVEDDAMQCWTERFKDGEYLAEFRSPFNSRNNLGHLHNHYHEYFTRYFNLGRLCIAVNMIQTMFQEKNNGSDMDSDSLYVTNQPDVVEHARYCYLNYPTIVNKIPKSKNIYNNSMESFATIDNKLAKAQSAIGQSSNLAQIALTYTYNFPDQKYQDYVCILSVLAQVAIDNAKRTFDIDLTDEINRIKRDMDVEANGLPAFWEHTKKDKRKFRTDEQRREAKKANRQKIKDSINNELVCPMNFISNLKVGEFKDKNSILPIKEFFVQHNTHSDRRVCKKVEEFIQEFSLRLLNYNISENTDEEYLLLREDFYKLIEKIKTLYISKNYADLMSWLINRAFMITAGVTRNVNTIESTISYNKALLLKVLYTVNPVVFLSCFAKPLYT